MSLLIAYVILSEIKAKTDNLPANPASQANLDAAVSSRAAEASMTLERSKLAILDLWSGHAPQVVVSTVAGDKALPSITIAGIPAGAVIQRAVMMLKFRYLENTNAAVNSLSGSQVIQAQKHVGGAWLTGIALAGGELAIGASALGSGDIMMGGNDIKDQVPANGGVMDFKWTSALAAQNNLNINDVQVGIRIFFNI